MKVQELFPIGSVVKLRNGIRPLMIFGYQTDEFRDQRSMLHRCSVSGRKYGGQDAISI